MFIFNYIAKWLQYWTQFYLLLSQSLLSAFENMLEHPKRALRAHFQCIIDHVALILIFSVCAFTPTSYLPPSQCQCKMCKLLEFEPSTSASWFLHSQWLCKASKWWQFQPFICTFCFSSSWCLYEVCFSWTFASFISMSCFLQSYA